jgi:polyhydroxyalkanoate synthase
VKASRRSASDPAFVSPEELAGVMADIAGQSHQLMQKFLAAQQHAGVPGLADPLGIGRAFLELTGALISRPEKLIEAQFKAWNAGLNLWLDSAGRMLGTASPSSPEPGTTPDKRFRHEAWEQHPFFDFIRQSYLIAAETMLNLTAEAEGLDEKTRHKVHFYTRQFVDALSPTNFAATNPEVLQETVRTHGANLLKGLRQFVRDFDVEKGRLRIRMTDTSAFEPGKNVAVSPGKVVFQNHLMQLIQYAPTTEQVYRRPLLIVPPWINKYYVLDLQPKNSFVRWLCDQGHTVFMISWVNPDESHAEMDFPDYALQGPLAALDAIERATGERDANVIGYCIGGTLLGAVLAFQAATGDERFVSATFLATLLDFSQPGDLGVFIDELQLGNLERMMQERGYHEGSEMSATFNLLRANDLIWSFYVNHYLLGKDPVPFDLLYWNSDCTRLPAKMHSTYLRTMYLENRFREPGGLSIGGVPLDLRSIRVPAWFLSTEDDHIAPWKGTYLGAQLPSGPVRFVLGKSGHIAGVVNPPAAQKYGYRTGPDVNVDAETWLKASESRAGSWWPHWQQWVEGFAGDRIPARQPGSGALPALEDAPGSYVRARI